MEKEDEVLEEVSLFDEKNPVEDAVKSVEEVEEKPSEEESEVQIPDKFKDKSMEDVVQSYVNLEKELGRSKSEIGELRKLTDQILLNQANRASRSRDDEENNDLGFDDLVDNPKVAVNKAIDDNPRLKKMEETLEKQAAEAAQKALVAIHNDALDILDDPDFHKWLGDRESRQKMLNQAHMDRDVQLAADVIDMYKTQHKATNEEAVNERDAKAKADLKKAAVSKGNKPTSTKPIYRRDELIRLKISDPDRYSAMYDDIVAAYAEGRVK